MNRWEPADVRKVSNDRPTLDSVRVTRVNRKCYSTLGNCEASCPISLS